MPVTPPKCKFCDFLHWQRICPNIGRAKVTVLDKEKPAPKALLPPPPAAKAKKKAKKS